MENKRCNPKGVNCKFSVLHKNKKTLFHGLSMCSALIVIDSILIQEPVLFP